jgi:hypothetical protein
MESDVLMISTNDVSSSADHDMQYFRLYQSMQ